MTAGIPLLIACVVIIVIARMTRVRPEEARERVAKPSDIDDMDGLEFEKYVAERLRRNGFSHVQVTRGSGDYGADILATQRGERYCIQCKRYAGKVGIRSVQEVYAAKRYYGCSKAIVITNNYFTPQAIAMAKKCDVLLYDRGVLFNKLRA